MIFVVEDDAQNGVDHVDGHRTIGYVVSPYTKRGMVDSHYYSQLDMIRTMEQILGLPAMNQMDLAIDPISMATYSVEARLDTVHRGAESNQARRVESVAFGAEGHPARVGAGLRPDGLLPAGRRG